MVSRQQVTYGGGGLASGKGKKKKSAEKQTSYLVCIACDCMSICRRIHSILHRCAKLSRKLHSLDMRSDLISLRAMR